MAEVVLRNIADFTADYNGEEVSFSSNEVSTTIITGITTVKSVDKQFWVDGPLTYTIVVNNNSGIELSDVVLTDYLDPSVITFNSSYSVKINGVDSPYTIAGNILTVNLPAIQDGGQVTVTFQVMQA